jgi:phenylpyruvate tautomerase PptA (4-oxalocrotonate tautomerase family)
VTKRFGRRQFLAAGGSAVALAAAAVRAAGREKAAPPRPNIVVIVVDDMRFDEYGAGGHPFELRNLAAEPAHAGTVARARETLASLVVGALGLPVTRPL